MTAEQKDGAALVLTLAGPHLPVSALSSLLRVLQAAVREVARAHEATRLLVDGPGASLHITSLDSDGGGIAMSFGFVSSDGSSVDAGLSDRVFGGFMDRLGGYLTAVSQPSLWGRTGRPLHPSGDESDLTLRMDQVRSELRRFPRSTLEFGNRKISIEGDHMELS